jgi:hypothetical protein
MIRIKALKPCDNYLVFCALDDPEAMIFRIPGNLDLDFDTLHRAEMVQHRMHQCIDFGKELARKEILESLGIKEK